MMLALTLLPLCGFSGRKGKINGNDGERGMKSHHDIAYSAPLSKNAVSAFQISCKLLSFTLKIPEEISRRSMLFHN